MVRSTRRYLRMIASLALVVPAVAACTSSASGGTHSAGSTGGTLRVALSKPAGNLDPFKFDAIWNVQNLVFEPLVHYGAGGKLTGQLAESWQISPDGLTYTFHLRPGVKFSDGTAFDAQAALFSLKKWVGNKRFDFLGTSSVVSDMSAVDAHTLRLTLKHPYSPLLEEMSLTRPVRFLSPKSADAAGNYRTPVGTGPFTVKSNTQSETVLLRNNAYWGSKPTLAEVDFKVITDSQSRLTALRAGNVDLIGGDFVAPMTPQDATTLKQSATGIRMSDAVNTSTLVLGFNNDPGRATADPQVRKAISLAINRQALATGVFSGYAQPAGALFPPVIPDGDTTPAPARDVAQSKGLLAAAGWTGSGTLSKNGQLLRLRLLASPDSLPGSGALAQAIQSELKDIGVNVVIDSADHATYHDAVPARKWDMNFFTTLGAPYDPPGTLTDLFQTSVQSGPDGKIFPDKGLDPLIQAALAAPTDADIKSAYAAVYAYLNSRNALAPLLYTKRLWAYGPKVHGFSLPPTEYDVPAAGITVS